MQNRLIEVLIGVRKLVIASLASAMIAVIPSPHARAQAQTLGSDESAFRNVSVRFTPTDGKNAPTVSLRLGSSFKFDYLSMRGFIADAYGVAESQVVGRDWSK